MKERNMITMAVLIILLILVVTGFMPVGLALLTAFIYFILFA